jgi:hypothetical protein
MRPIRRAAVTGLLAAWLAPLPALAGSQSSNASSSCSDGRCSRVESHVVEDRHGRAGWTRVGGWVEGAAGSQPRRPDRDVDNDDDD